MIAVAVAPPSRVREALLAAGYPAAAPNYSWHLTGCIPVEASAVTLAAVEAAVGCMAQMRARHAAADEMIAALTPVIEPLGWYAERAGQAGPDVTVLPRTAHAAAVEAALAAAGYDARPRSRDDLGYVTLLILRGRTAEDEVNRVVRPMGWEARQVGERVYVGWPGFFAAPAEGGER